MSGSSTSWMDAIPTAAPTTAMQLEGAPAPAMPWKPPPGAKINYVPTIDVTATPHPGAAQGQPGSQFAPSAVGNEKAPANIMPAPTKQPGAGTSWMDAVPAAKPTIGMQLAAGETFQPKGWGVVANLGAGTSETVADTLGAPVDLAAGALNLIPRGINAVAGTHLPTIQNPVGGSEWWKSAQGLIGADPRTVQANTEADRLARAGGAGVAGMLLPWAGARAAPALADAAGAVERLMSPATATASPALTGIPGAVSGALGAGGAPTMAAAGLLGGIAGQEAADSVPAPWKPVAQFSGNMLGGGIPFLARDAGGAFLRNVGELAQRYGQPLREGNATSWLGQKLDQMAGGGRMAAAGQRILGAASDPNAVADALENAHVAQQHASDLQAVVDDPTQPQPRRDAAQQLLTQLQPHTGQLVPGSEPTTYQLTGDQGLGGLERVAAKNNPEAFIQRANQQNAARVGALEGGAGATASPDAIGRAARQALADSDAAAEQEVERLRGAAQAHLNAAGGEVPPGGDAQASALQAYGTRLRAGLDALNQAAKQRVSRLYDAVDPDGTLNIDMRDIRNEARTIAKEWPKNAEPLSGAPGRAIAQAQMQKSVESFRELQALRSRLTTAMRDELYEHGRSPTYAALSRLLGAVDGAIESGVEEAAARDGNVASRIDALGAAHGHVVGGRGGEIPVQEAGGGTPGVPGAGGDAGAGGQRPGGAGGNRAVAPPAAASGRQPESLVDYLIAKGGLRDQGGDLSAIGADAIHHKAGGRLVNPNGLTLDQARELAEQEGFLRPGSTINDLLDALRGHVSGRPAYRISEQAEGTLRAQAARETEAHRVAMERAAARVSDIENEAGLRLTQAEHDHAAMLVANGVHPEEAVRDSLAGGDEAILQRNAERNAAGRPGVPAGAEQAELGEMPQTANWTPEKAAQYRAANAGHRERVQTFQQAPGVGDVLATGKTKGEWKLGDSRVPGALFTAGKGAAERVRAFLNAGGDKADLVDDLKDYAAFDLRRHAELPDGTLDPQKFARWRAAHDEALSVFPGLKQKFETAAEARRVMDEAVARHAEERQAFERSAAGKFLGDADPVLAMGRMLRADDGAAQMRDLVQRLGSDPAAKAGMRRAAVDFMLDELRTNALAGDMRGLKPDAFQTFLRRSQPARRVLFGARDAEMQDRIGADLQRAQKSVSGTKLPGGSNTAQDIAAGKRLGGEERPSFIGSVALLEAGGEGAKGLLGERLLARALGVVGVAVANAMRESGLHTINDLVAEAMLHPELARTLLTRVPTAANAPGFGKMLAGQIRALAVNSAIGGRRRDGEKGG